MAILKDVVIVFRLNGERKEFHYRKLLFKAWRDLLDQFSLTPSDLIARVSRQDVVAIGALIWLERRQREPHLSWSQFERESDIMEYDFEPKGAVIDGDTSLLSEDEPWPAAEPPDPTS